MTRTRPTKRTLHAAYPLDLNVSAKSEFPTP
jgi:hypothetical protein